MPLDSATPPAGSHARLSLRFRSREGAGARAREWLPWEATVYEGARADIVWEAHIAPDARLIAWDVTWLGRTGSGERFERGRCRLSTRLWRGGRLAWSERGCIAPGRGLPASPAGLPAEQLPGR